MQLFLVVLTAVFFLLLAVEKRQAVRDRSRLQHVVYVNGIRGKSTVTRLIDAGLRAGGYKVFCKTTGTDPMTIDVNNREELIRRRGRANIKEQLAILRRASGQGAEILVAECMAVDPQLQKLSQVSMLQADIAVITNVRLDHTEEMGETLEEIGLSLCGTISGAKQVFTAEEYCAPLIRREAEKQGCAFFAVRPHGDEEVEKIDFAENVELALAVCGALGVPREEALKGMGSYKRDPYALSFRSLPGESLFINGLSINDPQSTRQVWLDCREKYALQNHRLVLLINNRPDRGYRTDHMILLSRWLAPDEVWVMGASRQAVCRRLGRELAAGTLIRPLASPEKMPLPAEEKTVIFAVGNLAGGGRKLLEKMEREGTEFVS